LLDRWERASLVSGGTSAPSVAGIDDGLPDSVIGRIVAGKVSFVFVVNPSPVGIAAILRGTKELSFAGCVPETSQRPSSSESACGVPVGPFAEWSDPA